MKSLNKEYTFIKDPKSSDYILTEEYNGVRIKTRYVELYAPDKIDLYNLLRYAMGDHSSMNVNEFARICSDKKACSKNKYFISPYIFRKILSRKGIIRPLKPEVIQAILNNAEDKVEVCPGNLLRANGLEIKDMAADSEIREHAPDDIREFCTLKLRAEKDIQRKLASVSPYFYKLTPAEKEFSKSGFRLSNRYGFLKPYDINTVFVESQTIKAEDKGYWAFFIDDTEPDEVVEKTGIVRDHSDLFFDDQLYSVELKKNRGFDYMVSFVCQNVSWYNCAVKELEDLEVNGYMSVILIQNGEIVAEHTLNQTDREKPESILFEGDDKNAEVFCRRMNKEFRENKVEYLFPDFGY